MLFMGMGKFTINKVKHLNFKKKMKKMEYIAPEEQIIKLELKNALLSGSNTEEAPDTGDSDEV